MEVAQIVPSTPPAVPRFAGLCLRLTWVGACGVAYLLLYGVVVVWCFASARSIMPVMICELLGMVVVPVAGVCLLAALLLDRQGQRAIALRVVLLMGIAVLVAAYQLRWEDLANGGMRLRVHSVSDERQLQVWASVVLAQPVSELPVQHHWSELGRVELRRDRMPPFVRRLCSWHGPEILTQPDGSRCIRLAFLDSHVSAYGLYLGSSNLRVPASADEVVHLWQPGVFAWRGTRYD